MSMALDLFCFSSLLIKLTAVVLSTCMSVGGCGWLRIFRTCRRGRASRALSNAEAISVSAAELRTCLRMLHNTCVAPFGFALDGSNTLWAKAPGEEVHKAKVA